MSAFVPIIEEPDENKALFNIVGSNTTIAAAFASDTREAYTHYYAQMNNGSIGSNNGYLVGVSNEIFKLFPRPVTSSNSILSFSSNAFVGIGTDAPHERLHVVGNMVLTGKIYDENGSEVNLGGGIWRLMDPSEFYYPTLSAPGNGLFNTSSNVVLQRYAGNDVALSVNIEGAVVTKPVGTYSNADYVLSLPVAMNSNSYTIDSTIGEFWLTTSSNGLSPTVYKAVAKTIQGDYDHVAIRYLSGTTEVSLSSINAGSFIDLQGHITYQAQVFNEFGPSESITLEGDTLRWFAARAPHPVFTPPQGASVTVNSNEALMRYIGDDLLYRILIEADVLTQATNGDYKVSLEYPIASNVYAPRAIVGDLWLSVENVQNATQTTFKAYAQTIPGDSSNVSIRFLNGTYDQSLVGIDSGTRIRIQGSVVYKSAIVSSLAIPRAYLPNNIYQDNDGNVALNNYGRPMRARFEIVETSNLPALIVDQHSSADIAQFRSNTSEIKMIIDHQGNIGVGTTIAPEALTVRGNMLFDGTMFDATGNAIWIPGSSVNWQATQLPPVITIPNGGVWTSSLATGLWRYIGNEVNYNVTVAGVMTTAPSPGDPVPDFRLSLPYPIKPSVYTSAAILGELWADVVYEAAYNTFKAYAKPDPLNTNNVIIRVLTGTSDESLSSLTVGSTLTLRGEIKYATNSAIQLITPYTTYEGTAFKQDQGGQIVLNGGGNLPRARFDVVSGPNGSDSNAMILDQRGTGDALIIMNQGNPLSVITSEGHIGIGTTSPRAALEVAGHILPSSNEAYDLGSSNLRFRDLYISGNSIDLGGTTISRDPQSGGLAVLNAISNTPVDTTVGNLIATSNVSVGFDEVQSGSALSVNQTGTGSILELQDNGVTVFRVIDGGNVGIGTTVARQKLDIIGSTIVTENIGIGTTVPLEKVHVKGNVLLEKEAPLGETANVFIKFKETGYDDTFGIGCDFSGSGNENRLLITGSSTNNNPSYTDTKIVIELGGNVGIGITNPTSKLHVDGNIVTTGTLRASNLEIIGEYVTLNTVTSNTEQIVVTNAGTGPALKVTQTGANSIAEFYDDNDALALKIADGGNVGIGTTSPTEKLQVQGNVQATAFSGSGASLTALNANNVSSGTLAVERGGTGNASYVIGDLLYASGTTTLSNLAAVATGSALISGGVNAAPSWGKVGLTTHVSGTLGATNGGTGRASYAIGDLLYASGTTTLSNLADVETGSALISGGVNTAPSWGKVGLTTHVSGTLGATNGGTGRASYVVGDLLYASGTTTLSNLADVETGNALISGGVNAAPSWGKVGLTTHVSGTLGVINGGTGSNTLATNKLLVGNGTNAVLQSSNLHWDNINGRLGIGTDQPNASLHVNGSFSKDTEIIQKDSVNLLTAGWYILGTFGGQAGSRLELKIFGANGYSAYNTDPGGYTLLTASINDNAFGSIGNCSGTFSSYGGAPAVSAIKLVQNGSDRFSHKIYAYVEINTKHTLHATISKGATFTEEFTATTDPGSTSSTLQNALHVLSTVKTFVGIGTTNPSSVLHVRTLGVNALQSIMRVDDVGAGTTPFIIDSTGKVGIGTTVLASALHVHTQSGHNYIRISGPAAQQQAIEFADTSSRWIIYKPGNSTALRFYAASADRFQVDASGNVIATGDVSAFGSISDSNLKENVSNLNSGLYAIEKLRPVLFNWKTDIFNEEKRGKHDVGFIAQEVEQILPLAVGSFEHIGTDAVYKNIKHERILPYMVSAIQELAEENRKKDKIIAELEKRLAQIEAKLAS